MMEVMMVMMMMITYEGDNKYVITEGNGDGHAGMRT